MDKKEERSVFAYGVPMEATEKNVSDFFSKVGQVRDVKLVTDQSRTSKLVAHIEYDAASSVPEARALSGRPFLGKSLLVKLKPSEAENEKDIVRSNTSTCADRSVTKPTSRTIVVKNLPFGVTEEHLDLLFYKCGPSEQILLEPGASSAADVLAYVQFYDPEDAVKALCFDGHLDIANRIIEVSSASELRGSLGNLELGNNDSIIL